MSSSPVTTSLPANERFAATTADLQRLGSKDLRDDAEWAKIVDGHRARLEELRRPFRELMKELGVDVLFFPTTDTGPMPIVMSPRDVGRQVEGELLARASSLAHDLGLPELTVPAGTTEEGRPRGTAFVGLPFSEVTLFQVGHAFEQVVARRRLPNLDRAAPRVDVVSFAPPTNDAFAAAQELVGEQGTFRGTTSWPRSRSASRAIWDIRSRARSGTGSSRPGAAPS